MSQPQTFLLRKYFRESSSSTEFLKAKKVYKLEKVFTIEKCVYQHSSCCKHICLLLFQKLLRLHMSSFPSKAYLLFANCGKVVINMFDLSDVCL